MHNYRVFRILNIVLVVCLFLGVGTAVFAADQQNSTVTARQIDATAADDPEAVQESGEGAGVAITLSIVGFVLLLVAIVSIIGAVGLGIIGIGAASIQTDDD